VGLEQTAAGGLLEVRTPSGRAALVPFVRPIVVEVRAEDRLIVLDPPEGLFDL
jgi:ribosomal 30S subunit maturation factor RimM